MKNNPLLILLILLSFTITGYSQAWQWAKSIQGGVAAPYVRAIATDLSGNSYVTGTFLGQTSFESQTLIASGVDGFVAKYDNLETWSGLLKLKVEMFFAMVLHWIRQAMYTYAADSRHPLHLLD
ncbi:hypothetical protein WSM22_25780 [Cytophagales bacterium WSM2-2]|nr:hypothetical protein WSM22_25780 [Cytophagales bacterium WSM2-2]